MEGVQTAHVCFYALVARPGMGMCVTQYTPGICVRRHAASLQCGHPPEEASVNASDKNVMHWDHDLLQLCRTGSNDIET
jgi:hypothetical protein